MQKNNGNEAERQKKMDDENDVFHRFLRLLAEYRAVHREDCRSGQGPSYGVPAPVARHSVSNIWTGRICKGKVQIMPHDIDDPHSQPHSHLPSDPVLRVRALETILTRKGLIDPAALDEIIDTYENHIGPQNGARVVARAWAEPEFREALLADADTVLAELDLNGRQGEHVVVVENTPARHNMVVCTLCSCYPWPLLGIPPGWYKSDAYRARAVREPRKVLAEFGVTLPAEVAVRVWDSTAEVRYLVLPMRPAGTEGWSVEALERLVSRDSMIGTGLALQPDDAAARGAQR